MRKAKVVIDEISTWLDLPEKGSWTDLKPMFKVIPKPEVVSDQIARATELLHPTNLLLGKVCFDQSNVAKTRPVDSTPEYIGWLKQIIPSIEYVFVLNSCCILAKEVFV